MYDSTDWIPAFDVKSWPVYVYDLGTLHANSYIQDNPLVLLRRFESVNYTFRLAESVTDLSVKVFTLPDSEFKCALNASNAQMDLHGEILPHFNVWYNVPENTYMMNLEVESAGAQLVRVVIQAGSRIESPSVKILGMEPTSIFATPSGTMNYKIDVWFNVTTYDDLVLTATLGGQVVSHTYAVEPFKPGVISDYLQVDAPSEIGQYTVDFNASLLNLGIFDSASATLNVDTATYNITVSPTVRYYKDHLKWDVWKGQQRDYVDSQSELAALDVTNIMISSIDERDPQTGKPSKVSISFDAANKEKDVHHVVYVKIGSDDYQLGVVIGGDEPGRMEAHNIPVINGKVSFTILYRKWDLGNWGAEVGTEVAKTLIDVVLPCVAPELSPAWFATGDLAMNFAKYTMLYTMQIWMERENAYMTIDDAARIIENSGIEQSVFKPFLTTAVGITRSPFHAFLAALNFLHRSGKMSTWNYARACVAALGYILGRAEARLLDVMTDAFTTAAGKLGITLVAKEIVKEWLGKKLNPECFLRDLGIVIDGGKAIWKALKVLFSPGEEGKELSDAQIGSDPAVKVDPIISVSFDGQVDYTNETDFGDILNMDISLNQTEAQAILKVDGNLTAVYLATFSSPVWRLGFMSSFGFNASTTELIWQHENNIFIIDGEGSPYPGLIALHFCMNSTHVKGTQVMSLNALQADDVAWLNGTLRYPFGKDLAYEINVTLPRGSEIIQILSDGNFTVEDNMIVWNTPIDGLAIEFAPPNVAITGVVPAKTVVCQDCRTSVNVTVANHSNSTQAVNITVYANAIIIGAQTAFIESKMSTTIVLDWNTMGFAPGNYTIRAYASPLPGEINTADNEYVDGTVQILQTYSLSITTTVGGTTNPAPGTYSYTANSTVQVTAIPDANYLFDYWELDMVNVGSANPYTVLMDNNHTLKAVFTYSPPPPSLSASISPLSASILVGQSVTFTSTVSGGYTPYSYQWYLNGNPVSGATSNTWTFTPTTGGIYYVHLRVTDAKGNIAQSETARITVATVPVGGYSIPIQLPTKAQPVTIHIALLTILTAIFTTIKRKAKRKH
jgi:hypothetical protein